MQNSSSSSNYHAQEAWQSGSSSSLEPFAQQTSVAQFAPTPYAGQHVQTPNQQYPQLSSEQEMHYSFGESAASNLMTSQSLQVLHSSGDILHSSNMFEPMSMHGSGHLLASSVPPTPQGTSFGVAQPDPGASQSLHYQPNGSYSQMQNYSPLHSSGHHSLATSGAGLVSPTQSLSQSDASLQSYAQYHNIYMQGQFGDAHMPAATERRISAGDDDSYSTFSGDITPPHHAISTAPMTPSAADDDLQPRRLRNNPRRPRSADSNPEDDGMAQHDISAQVVFQALKTVGQTISMTHENLKLQNQLLAIQQRAGGAASPGPMPPVVSPSPPMPEPVAAPPNIFQPPPAKRVKTEAAVSIEDAQNAIKQLEKEEEAKINELQALRSKMAAYRSTLLAEGNWLADEHMEQRQHKKLAKNCYEAIYFSLLENVNGVRERFFVDDHPRPEKLSDLAGVIYVLKTFKIHKKPPQVGFSFRSYSDSHYTSVERTTPIICKVKEWPAEDDTTKCYRLYHYYLGTQKKKKAEGGGKK